MGRRCHPSQASSGSSNPDALADPDTEANPNPDATTYPVANAPPYPVADASAHPFAEPNTVLVSIGLTNGDANPGTLPYGGPSADGLDPDGSPTAGSRHRRRPAFYRRRAGGISSGTCNRPLCTGRHGRSRFGRPG
jgi:hypothetical protein